MCAPINQNLKYPALLLITDTVYLTDLALILDSLSPFGSVVKGGNSKITPLTIYMVERCKYYTTWVDKRDHTVSMLQITMRQKAADTTELITIHV